MAKYTGWDFCGWATRNDIKCSDGRTIRRDAFAHQDGAKVPLVWSHNHDSPGAVLGHGFLENRPEGVFFYGYFNGSEDAQRAKQDVQHKDVTSLSIWANQLKQQAGNVIHGSIKEVSLVLAGANMGAQITNVALAHGDTATVLEDEAYIFTGEEYGLELAHTDTNDDTDMSDDDEYATGKNGGKNMDEKKTVQDVLNEMTEEQLEVVSYLVGKAASEGDDESLGHADMDEDATVDDVLDTMTDEQREVVDYLIESAVADAIDGVEEEMEHYDFGGESMNWNAFEGMPAAEPAPSLSHADQGEILGRAKKLGRLSDALKEYADANELMHDDEGGAGVAEVISPRAVGGFTSYPDGNTPAGIDAMFPEPHDMRTGAPLTIYSDREWVQAVLRKVNKVPFRSIRTTYVDLRNDEALRAKGYSKGQQKLLTGNIAAVKRVTNPTTIYVKNALNKDDITDITDFDYVAYLEGIDRKEWELELARAIMISDGRQVGAEDKISEECIRPIWTDSDVYTIHKVLTLSATSNGSNTAANFGEAYRYADAAINALLEARDDFRGTGVSEMFCVPDFYRKLMNAKDMNGRRMYNTKSELNAALDIGGVHTVPEFRNKTRTVGNKTYRLLAIVGNLADYALGQVKGGELTHVTQFDIDFNQQKSLTEGRMCGANVNVFSFIVLEEEVA